jgi:hypothetical protein
MCATEVSMAMGRRGLQAEVTQRVARGRVGRDHLVEVVKLVGGLELGKAEKLGAEGVDESVEGHAVLPRGVHGGKVVW